MGYLPTSIEKSAKRCLVQEQEAIEEQVRKEAEKERLSEIDKALAECDTDFFEDEMTNDERMDTWEKRQDCLVEKTDEIVTKPQPVIPVVTEPVSVPVVKPVTVPVPVIEKPAVEEVIETMEVANVQATATAEVSEEVTTEEAPIVEQQPEPIKEKSIFKRVVNFFTSLFSW